MRYNLDLMEAVELGFLLDLAEVVALGALYRKESRGGHFREDYESRDDATFLHHTMAYRTLDGEEEIGRASCRERVWIAVAGADLQYKARDGRLLVRAQHT